MHAYGADVRLSLALRKATIGDVIGLDAFPMTLRSRWFIALIFLLNALALGCAARYFGRIYQGWDAQFYYAGAHSLLFDRDADVTNNLMQSPYTAPFDPQADGSWSAAPRRADGRITSKYPLGMSLTELPLLAIGTVVRRTAATFDVNFPETSGYSSAEIWTVALGLQLLFAVGLAALFRILRQEFGLTAALLGIEGCWFGTSLFYYSGVFPFMAHAATFTLLAILLSTVKAMFETGATNSKLGCTAVLLAALFLVRPQQVLVGFAIALWLLPLVVRKPVRAWLPGVGLGAVASIAAIAVQVTFLFAQFDVATWNGYAVGGEGFLWTNPHIADVLFDPDKGLISISPIVLPAAFGFVAFRRSIPAYVWPFVANAAVQIYVIAAWSSPEQGQSFGCRMWSDNAGVVAFGLAALYGSSKPMGKGVVAGVIVCSAAWTTFQLAQYVGWI